MFKLKNAFVCCYETSELDVNGVLVASSTSVHLTRDSSDSPLRLTLTIGDPLLASMNDQFYRSICHYDGTSEESKENVIDVDNLYFYSCALSIQEIEARTVN